MVVYVCFGGVEATELGVIGLCVYILHFVLEGNIYTERHIHIISGGVRPGGPPRPARGQLLVPPRSPPTRGCPPGAAGHRLRDPSPLPSALVPVTRPQEFPLPRGGETTPASGEEMPESGNRAEPAGGVGPLRGLRLQATRDGGRDFGTRWQLASPVLPARRQIGRL